MRGDALDVEDQDFGVELHVGERVQRERHDAGQLRAAVPQPPPARARRRWFNRIPIGANRTVGVSGPNSLNVCARKTSGYSFRPAAPLRGGFSVAQIIMWSSSFLQPYFSVSLVFCTT